MTFRFQETRGRYIPFDRLIKQAGMETPSLFNIVMKDILKPLVRRLEERKIFFSINDRTKQ